MKFRYPPCLVGACRGTEDASVALAHPCSVPVSLIAWPTGSPAADIALMRARRCQFAGNLTGPILRHRPASLKTQLILSRPT